jgi:hypothetical protein
MGDDFCEANRSLDRRLRGEAIDVMIDFLSPELEKSI